MKQTEKGFLLLTSQLGNPERKPLTVAQFRTLAKRVSQVEMPVCDRELSDSDVMALGYSEEFSRRIVSLLEEEQLLEYYLRSAKKQECTVITRVSETYPQCIRKKLGLDAPGSLWCKGDPTILQMSCVSLVGSREIREENRLFSAEVGRQAALQGYALVSGNARGADRIAQEACLEMGGYVISVVADELETKITQSHVLYVSENGFDLAFTAARALSRNHLIHSLSPKTFVAQCQWKSGGTWDGSVKNLQNGWSDLYCYADGSPAASELADMGATFISVEELSDIGGLKPDYLNFLHADG